MKNKKRLKQRLEYLTERQNHANGRLLELEGDWANLQSRLEALEKKVLARNTIIDDLMERADIGVPKLLLAERNQAVEAHREFLRLIKACASNGNPLAITIEGLTRIHPVLRESWEAEDGNARGVPSTNDWIADFIATVRATDQDGSVARIVEELSLRNPILADAAESLQEDDDDGPEPHPEP